MVDVDSSEMLSRLQAGGDEELAALFVSVRGNIKQMVSLRLDDRLRARVDASDIVQEAFVRASKGLKSYLESPSVHPIVWLRLIGKRILAETHRRHFRDKRSPYNELVVEADSSDILVNRLADSMHSVHANVAHQEIVQKVLTLIADLPQQDREILEMRHTEGMTIQEIAAMMEISVEAAKKRYQRALVRVRHLTTDLGG